MTRDNHSTRPQKREFKLKDTFAQDGTIEKPTHPEHREADLTLGLWTVGDTRMYITSVLMPPLLQTLQSFGLQSTRSITGKFHREAEANVDHNTTLSYEVSGTRTRRTMGAAARSIMDIEFKITSMRLTRMSDAQIVAQWPLIEESGAGIAMTQTMREAIDEYDEDTALQERIYQDDVLHYSLRTLHLSLQHQPRITTETGYHYDTVDYPCFDSSKLPETLVGSSLHEIDQLSWHDDQLMHEVDVYSLIEFENALVATGIMRQAGSKKPSRRTALI